MQRVTTKRITNSIFFFSVIVLFSLMSLAAINASFSVTGEIYNGVKVGNIDVGGLSAQAAKNKIATVFLQKTKQPPITLTYDNQSWAISADAIGLKIDANALSNRAYAVGRTGNIFFQLQEKYMAINHGHIIPLALVYDSAKLTTLVNGIAQKIDKAPKNASLNYHKGSVSISPDEIGYKTDVTKTLSEIVDTMQVKLPFSLPIVINTAIPIIQAQDLKKIDGLISSYSTEFNTGNQNRSQNIAIAAKNINGILIRPGEEFSFNKYVGLRLEQYGYKIAPVFISGKLTKDWGGGVCQVSSTLYNAALLADMTITERTSHYRPPGYVPIGQDATVADNQLDFKFTNSSHNNIFITTAISGNQLTVSIFGKLSPNPPEIQIVPVDKKVLEPDTIVKQDPGLELGKEIVDVEGQKGFQLSTFRVKYINGKEISREFLAADEFPPEDRVVRLGTRVPDNTNK